MGLGDLCYESSGGSLAYSKGGTGSLIYRGTWRWEVSWTGDYGTRFANSPRTQDFSSAQTSVSDFVFPDSYPSWIYWLPGPRWVRWDRTPYTSILQFRSTEPTSKDGYVNYYDWYLSSDYLVVFSVGNWSSYGGGYGVRAFGSSSPSGAFTQIATNSTLSDLDIGNVEIDIGWV